MSSADSKKLPYCPGAWASVYATRDVVKDAQYHLFFEDFTMAPTICGLERERHWPIMSLPLARESACAECVQRFKNCIFGETEQSQGEIDTFLSSLCTGTHVWNNRVLESCSEGCCGTKKTVPLSGDDAAAQAAYEAYSVSMPEGGNPVGGRTAWCAWDELPEWTKQAFRNVVRSVQRTSQASGPVVQQITTTAQSGETEVMYQAPCSQSRHVIGTDTTERKVDDLKPGDEVFVKMRFWRMRSFPFDTAILISYDDFTDQGPVGATAKFVQVNASEVYTSIPRDGRESE